jgi:hypothetical protein
MHHASEPADGLVTIRAAAKEVGVSHSTISRKVGAGLIPSHNGKVRVSEVRAALSLEAAPRPSEMPTPTPADSGAKSGAMGGARSGAPRRRAPLAPPASAPPVQAGTDELISVRACAKLLPDRPSHTTLVRQIQSGAIRSHLVDGDRRVRLTEVISDRANNLDLTKRSKKKRGASASPEVDSTGDDAPGQIEMVEWDGQLLSFADAQRLKENYIARKHHLDYLTKSRAVVDRRAAEDVFFQLSRQGRDAWTMWAPRISTFLAAEVGADAALLSEALSRHVHQHLVELGEPRSPALLAEGPAVASDGQPDDGVATGPEAAGADNG